MTEQFKQYLQQNRYRQTTINSHIQNIGYFFKWMDANGLPEPENISYNNLLEYIQYEQQQNKDVATINLRIASISKYFELLKQQGLIQRNPARTLRIKGKTKTVIQNPLKYDELLQLYNSYKTLKKEVPVHIQKKSELAHQRNTIILGLLIWQGLHSGELEKLETTHINLNEGIIYIPSTTRSNSRELKLSTQQILSMHAYIHGGVRNQLQSAFAKASEDKAKADELIIGNAHNIVSLLCCELKGINPIIKNALHIRASVILHWLRLHNKRQVQYMAGHKYISSTENYEVQELESLTDALGKHHPFG
jgi:site-specific recombinase XerD